MEPLVSVVITSYNREKYIRQCVESALFQDYENLEVIVVDDASIDKSPEILESFGNKIRYIRQENNRGIGPTLNQGFRIAKGDLLIYLDCDDFYLPGKIALSAQKLIEDNSVSMVYTDYITVDDQGNLMKEFNLSKLSSQAREETVRETLLECPLYGSNVMIRKQCFEKIGYFNENIICCHDYEMWLRLLKAGYRFGRVPKTLFAYRRHPGNFSRRNKELIRFNSDKIRSSAIEYFTFQELFGDFMKNNDWGKRVQKEYGKLMDICYLKHLPLSARAAAKKSLETGHPFSFFSWFLTNTPQIFPILYNILANTVNLILANISPKLTRKSANEYRWKINASFCRLRYRLSLLFRHGLNNRD